MRLMQTSKLLMLSVVVAAGACWLVPTRLVADDQAVKSQNNQVPWLNGNTNGNGWDKANAEDTALTTDGAWIASNVFTGQFAPFANGKYSDVGYPPDGFIISRVQDTNIAIQVKVRCSGTAALFPFYAEGNLGGTGGSGGSGGGSHWTVKSKNDPAVILLEIDADGPNDDAIPVGGTNILHVKIEGGASNTTYTVDLSAQGNPDGAGSLASSSVGPLTKDQEAIVILTGGTKGNLRINATITNPLSDPPVTNYIDVSVYDIQVILNGRTKVDPTVRQEGQDRFWLQSGEIVQFRADLSPTLPIAVATAIGKKFKWTLDAVPGITGNAWTPSPDWGDRVSAKGVGATGNPITITLGALPTDNQGFGTKTLTLEIVDHNKTASTTARLFFSKMAKGHPDPGKGTTANWYYYWSAEGNPGACKFSRDPNNAVYAKYWTNGNANGKYVATENTIYLSDKAAAKNSWTYTFPEGGRQLPNAVGFTINTATAPEFVNLTYAHEDTHRIISSKPLKVGEDRVPADWEADVGSSDSTADSFGAAFAISAGSPAPRDEEFYCVVGGTLTYGSFVQPPMAKGTPEYHGTTPEQASNDNDWSESGSHWKE